jgi:hypothetical protein
MQILYSSSPVLSWPVLSSWRPSRHEKLGVALWPILRTVKYARDFYRVFCDLINNDVGQGSEHQFPAAFHAKAGASHLGKLAKECASVIYRPGDLAGCLGIVAFYAFADTL